MQPELFVVVSTFPDAASAKDVARQLIIQKLASCANIIPTVESIFVWEGKLEEASESMAVFKVASATVDSLVHRLADLHPYDVPEILVLSPSGVSKSYADWVNSTCS